jgi:chaperonin GroEL (HSP60 family)
MDTDKIKIFGARVKVDGTGKLAELERAERVRIAPGFVVCSLTMPQEKMKAKVDAIAAHGINCFVNRQLIYNYPESLLAEKGIMTIEHADFEGVERLSLVTGGEIASTFDRPDLVNLGHCELIEEIMIGEDKVCCIHLSLQAISDWTAADKILRSRGRGGMYCGPAWLDQPNGRRGRAVTARRPLGALADSQRDTDGARGRMF